MILGAATFTTDGRDLNSSGNTRTGRAFTVTGIIIRYIALVIGAIAIIGTAATTTTHMTVQFTGRGIAINDR